jgi:hypothetical protein
VQASLFGFMVLGRCCLGWVRLAKALPSILPGATAAAAAACNTAADEVDAAGDVAGKQRKFAQMAADGVGYAAAWFVKALKEPGTAAVVFSAGFAAAGYDLDGLLRQLDDCSMTAR